jgi:hypothetical protein
MNGNRERDTEQARIDRICYSLGKLRATVLAPNEAGTERVVVEITGLSQARAISMVNAMSRLMTGGVVLDGQDLLAIRDSIDNARGLASALAPETADSTLVLASIERAHGQVRGVLAS